MHEFFPIREWDHVEGRGGLGSINLEAVTCASMTVNRAPGREYGTVAIQRPWWGFGFIQREEKHPIKTYEGELLPDGVRIWFLDRTSYHVEATPELLEVLGICNDEGEEDSE